MVLFSFFCFFLFCFFFFLEKNKTKKRSNGFTAAAAHSGIGNIAAGSTMAVGQSAGAGGSGLVIVNGAAQLGG